MADNVTEITTERPIYLGTELKFALEIEAEGFDMLEDDFKVIINNMQKSVVIEKGEMILTENDEFLFTLPTETLGTGDYYLTTVAQVPDADFDDGYRQEVQKTFLCKVTS